MRGRLLDKTARPIALYARDHVMASTLDAFGDDTESMILHGGGATDTTKEALLNTSLEFDDGNSRGRLTMR